jgi:hypothetical protein
VVADGTATASRSGLSGRDDRLAAHGDRPVSARHIREAGGDGQSTIVRQAAPSHRGKPCLTLLFLRSRVRRQAAQTARQRTQQVGRLALVAWQ